MIERIFISNGNLPGDSWASNSNREITLKVIFSTNAGYDNNSFWMQSSGDANGSETFPLRIPRI